MLGYSGRYLRLPIGALSNSLDGRVAGYSNQGPLVLGGSRWLSPLATRVAGPGSATQSRVPLWCSNAGFPARPSRATGHKTLHSAVTYNTQFPREICGQAAPARRRGSGPPRAPEVRGDGRPPRPRLPSGVAIPARPRCTVTAGDRARACQVEWLSPSSRCVR
jgi:hypothetical protein